MDESSPVKATLWLILYYSRTPPRRAGSLRTVPKWELTQERALDQKEEQPNTDPCSHLLRIHLLGYHVFPILLFGPRPGIWPNLDRGPGGICAHTSLIIWSDWPLSFIIATADEYREFCLRHKETRHVCGVGQKLS